jgi:hypothetical protein
MTACLIFGVLLIPLGACLYREVSRLCITIDGDMLVMQHAFSTRSVVLADIDGYRVGEKNAFFLVIKNGEKSLKLPHGITRRKELLAWIKEKDEDVDGRERAAETEVRLEDSRYGGSREEREQNLQKAGKISKICTGAGFVLFFWFFLYPQPYEIVMLLLFVAPLVAIYLTWSFKGMVRLYSKKSSPYPTLFILIMFPIMAAGLNAFMRYDLYGFSATAWLLLAGMIAIYSYGLLIYTNCHFDRSPAEAWRVAVTDKSESHGKTTTYYLQLSPWGKYAGGKEVKVSRAFYQAVGTQDSVGVLLNKGKWGIPWYRVVRYSH